LLDMEVRLVEIQYIISASLSNSYCGVSPNLMKWQLDFSVYIFMLSSSVISYRDQARLLPLLYADGVPVRGSEMGKNLSRPDKEV
jgi:hypothetical protein